MKYGYARVSSIGQAREGNSLSAQTEQLKAMGAEEIYVDVYTGKTTDRPQFKALITVLKSGDTLYVTKLDRFARSITEASSMIDDLLGKGVDIEIGNIGRLNNSAAGQLIYNVFLAFAQFERRMILERTAEGKAIAKQNPAFQEGRPRKFSNAQIEHALDLLEDNSYTQVERMTGISKSTLVRAHRRRLQG